MKIEEFIEALRATDKYIETIYMGGGCYQFHSLLKKMYPECEPMRSGIFDHVVTYYQNKYYDITGEITGVFHPLSKLDVRIAKLWNFSKNKMIQIGECSHCEEPITVQ